MLLLTLLTAASALDVRLRGPHPGVPAAQAAEAEAAEANTDKLLNEPPETEATPAPTPVSHVKGLGEAAGKTGAESVDAAAQGVEEGVDAASDSAAEAVEEIEGKMTTAEVEKAFAAMKKGDVEEFTRRLYKQMAITASIGGSVGLLLCGCVWFGMCRGSTRAPRRVTKEELKRGDFHPVGLCACCSWSAQHICETLFCTPFLWAETAAKLQVLDFFAILGLVGLAVILGPATASISAWLFIFARVYLRTATLRGRFKQDSSGACLDGVWDCCVHVFCFPCATAQEAEFVEHLEQHGIIKV